MILLGVLSGYSWGSFLTYLVFIDIVVLAICFALDRFVWSRDKGQTKNDRRNKRDEGDEEDGEHDNIDEDQIRQERPP